MNRMDALIDVADYARRIGLVTTAHHLLRLSDVDGAFDVEDKTDLTNILAELEAEMPVPDIYSAEFAFLHELAGD